MKWITVGPPLGRGFNFHRKLWHMGGLIVPLLLYADAFAFVDPADDLSTRRTILYILILLNLILAVMETLRMQNAGFRRFFHDSFGFLMKEQEKDRFHGTVAYMLATLTLFLFFTDEVIILSLLFLVLADPFAAFVGIHKGRVRFWNGKTLEGMMAFLIAASAAGLAFVGVHTYLGRAAHPFSFHMASQLPLYIIIGGSALIAALAEFFSFTALRGLIDDNITVPLATALSLVALNGLLGYPLAAVLFPGYLLI